MGSQNPVKLAAVRAALAEAGIAADICALEVPSGVPEQPIGLEETACGAHRRARNALEAAGADWGIGLEGGVEFDQAGNAWLFNVVAIAAGERSVWAHGGRLLLPPRISAGLRAGGELGPLIDDLIGAHDTKRGLGTIGHLTHGLITREESFRSCLARALVPLLWAELYDS
ncbi:MAG TPA: inosine/xanthosine triphosphatase [Roseiflexaceae bacterium]|nr:inosine/xanthosine triphosphatase [Roseiflexaceae bacterium]